MPRDFVPRQAFFAVGDDVFCGQVLVFFDNKDFDGFARALVRDAHSGGLYNAFVSH